METTYIIIILSMLLGKYALDTAANVLNLKTLLPSPPADLSDIYDSERYKKSQEYTAVNTRFGFVSSAFDLGILLIFWYFGGFGLLDAILRSWNMPYLVIGLLYVGVLTFAMQIVSLPFSFYHTFVIEERFGFNKTTYKTFILDRLKAATLTIVIGGFVLGVILALFRAGGDTGWLWARFFASAVSVFLTFISPNIIMPLFLKFTPLEDGELKDRIYELARKLEFPLAGIYVIDGSRRSTKANAFFAGFGKHKRIALFDTLLSNQTVPELVAVLGHEIGHYKKRHTLIGTATGILELGLMFFIFSFFLDDPALFKAFGVMTPSVYSGLVFFTFLYTLAAAALSVFRNILSRSFEYEADAFSAHAGGNSQDLISGLKKLSRDNLSNLTPHPFYVFLNYSHPPLKDRIAALKRIS
ncbi:MAG: peptidase M48 [Candidatus Sungbacteria bacterium RIFCSPLOWO2_01_FULL_47_10]|uniref:Peptidase M48 n=1 Tax=Candidatus Sungbacteria bacterium RIFCSPLOWO2_01_FULL_47_10 TaxID=1802276 RepID=A0A1G2L1E1_9BACT|nr:MAG: peptidase M48 [Candidatus Sungbacteria bacterium RIFCSPLOWO2_01_FULL_47_10]